ncbi:MAG: TCP-1/cpn60 chaperonin family protein, partial [Candidatus Heimdallarchaeaceae archaeon]
PRTLAENAGLDPIDIISELYSKHAKGGKTFGIDPFAGSVDDMAKLKVFEPISVKKQVISSASEGAMMILRIDDVIAAKELGDGPSPPSGGEDFD